MRTVDDAHPALLEGRVEARRPLAPEVWLLEVTCAGVSLTLAPGQFVQVHAFSGSDPLLRRPLAPFDVRRGAAATEVDLLVQVAGRGTRHLAELPVGACLDLVAPLGRGFTPVRAGERVVAVAGGVGVAPVHHLAREASAAGLADGVTVVLGAREAARLAGREALEALPSALRIATDTGDAGVQGTAVDALRGLLDEGPPPDRIVACGPEPMLRGLCALAAQADIPTEVSLERRMACGIGVCFTCVCPVLGDDGLEHNRRLCLEGPVLPADRLGAGAL